MVRKGSPVRVRKRALQKRRIRVFFRFVVRKNLLRVERAVGYGALCGARGEGFSSLMSNQSARTYWPPGSRDGIAP
jgi:hypothetical protein